MKNAMIHTEVLCKSYVSDGEINNVIKNMDLDIYEGDFTVVMGSSGSGKSTLLYALSGMDAVTTGKVFLDGDEITHKKEKELTQMRKNKIGFVFQNINLLSNLTAYENVLSPTYRSDTPKTEIQSDIEDLMGQLELTDHMKKFPNQLSGGQRQRVAICRALINHPKVLFADEPTGALNSSQGKEVLDIFSSLHEQNQSIVMVTHDLKAALRGNRVIYLRDGRIDGDLLLGEYEEKDIAKREEILYTFLKERGW